METCLRTRNTISYIYSQKILQKTWLFLNSFIQLYIPHPLPGMMVASMTRRWNFPRRGKMGGAYMSDCNYWRALQRAQEEQGKGKEEAKKWAVNPHRKRSASAVVRHRFPRNPNPAISSWVTMTPTECHRESTGRSGARAGLFPFMKK